MKTPQLLEEISKPWMALVSLELSSSEKTREETRQILERFYRQLIQAVKTTKASHLEPVLDEWLAMHACFGMESMEPELSKTIDKILRLTLEIVQEKLSEAAALQLISSVVPIFLHAHEYAARREVAVKVDLVSRELESANGAIQRIDRSKSDFLAIAAHELKTPLTLIEGYTSMLRDLLPKNDNFLQARILLKGVDNGTRRLHEIVDDMIDASLIDNNLLALHFQPVWVNRILLALKNEFARSVVERRLTLDVVNVNGCEEMTFGDEERLYQALRNIISNAIKFTPDGGKIAVQSRMLPGFIEVEVSDTGIGIDPKDHARIFEKFGHLGSASLHSSGKTKFKGGGPGLGLPIAKGIIEAHGGAIWVESVACDEKKCPGSTFHILLPVRKLPPDDRSATHYSPFVSSERAIAP